MGMDIAQPRNAKVLIYLSHGHPDAPQIAAHDTVHDPYYRCGCHPDIVARLWDQIGAALPADCRCLVHGTPALVHPKNGVILAVGVGTQYGLLLPNSFATEAITAGAKTCVTWSTSGSMDIRRAFGEDWVFGAWIANELTWCKTVYEMFGHAA